MKNFTLLLSCVICFSFTQTPPDLTFLYQSWSLKQIKYNNGNPFISYESTKELANHYGFQFRKDGTVSVSRAISNYPIEIKTIFEVVEGKWKISEDSIIEVTYSSNGYSYHETLVLKQLNALELVVHYQH